MRWSWINHKILCPGGNRTATGRVLHHCHSCVARLLRFHRACSRGVREDLHLCARARAPSPAGRAAASCTVLTVRCPFCRENDDKVVDSRAGEDGAAIRRRRECLACGRRFTTYERIDEHGLVVRKRDGTQEPFDRREAPRRDRARRDRTPRRPRARRAGRRDRGAAARRRRRGRQRPHRCHRARAATRSRPRCVSALRVGVQGFRGSCRLRARGRGAPEDDRAQATSPQLIARGLTARAPISDPRNAGPAITSTTGRLRRAAGRKCRAARRAVSTTARGSELGASRCAIVQSVSPVARRSRCSTCGLRSGAVVVVPPSAAPACAAVSRTPKPSAAAKRRRRQ